MKIKKYEVDSMQEAFMRIKAELGGDAVILHTKKFKTGGVLGLFSRERYEVLAANQVQVSDSSYMAEISEKFRSLQGEMREMKSFVHTLIKQMKPAASMPYPPEYEEFFMKLIQNEVEEKLVLKLITTVADEIKQGSNGAAPNFQLARQHFIDRIAAMLGAPSPIKLEEHNCKVVALIGPTGVGKTTTIAKLAAHFQLADEKRVALITADTYRIAAIEQLKKYAEILNVPVEVVFEPHEMKAGIARHTDKDLILIDTAGRSQRDTQKVFELKDYIEAARPSEVHLVISATTRYKDMLDVVEKFSVMPLQQVLFTKLDEATNFGTLLNVISKINKPISYITNGQNVPEDFEIPDNKKLARLILGDEDNG